MLITDFFPLNVLSYQIFFLSLHSQKELVMKKNITIKRESGIEIFNNLGNEILNNLKEIFPSLREVLIRTCGPTHIMVVFSFDNVYGYKKIIDYITEKYNLEYQYKEYNAIHDMDNFIFYL